MDHHEALSRPDRNGRSVRPFCRAGTLGRRHDASHLLKRPAETRKSIERGSSGIILPVRRSAR
jgi:hypothetical protein